MLPAFELLLLLIVAAFLFVRVHYGIDWTDESWYVGDAYLVSQGAVPYTNNWSQTPGYTLPLAIIYGMYVELFGTEGIVLFSRLLYVLWSIAVGLLVMWLVRKKLDSTLPLSWYLPYFLINSCVLASAIYNISYDSTGYVYLPLVITLVFCGWGMRDRRAFFYGLAAGVVGARMIIGSPFTMFPCFILFAVLLLRRENKLALGTLCGVLASAVVVVGWCCVRAGAGNFIYGMFSWLKDYCYFKIEKEAGFTDGVRFLLNYLKPAALYLFCAVLFRLVFAKREKAFGISLAVLMAVFLGAGMYRGCEALFLGANATVYFAMKICKYTWCGAFGLLLLKKKHRKYYALCLVDLLYFSVYVFSSFGNIYGFSLREYWLLMPSILSFTALYYLMAELSGVKNWLKAAFVIGICLILLMQFKAANLNIYRDEPIEDLNTKVETGIWKGCYTTRDTAAAVQELEAYIRQIGEPGEKLLFLDWVSFGYLMSESDFCTPSALDPCAYYYKPNNPEIFYDYFYMEKQVPDRIVYVWFDYAECLSIEDENWKFNDFVNSFYEKAQSGFENELFRVVEYKLTDAEAAIAYAEENASKFGM